LLKEAIRGGHVKLDKRELWDATNMFMGLWEATFGGGGTFRASEVTPLRQAAGGGEG